MGIYLAYFLKKRFMTYNKVVLQNKFGGRHGLFQEENSQFTFLGCYQRAF